MKNDGFLRSSLVNLLLSLALPPSLARIPAAGAAPSQGRLIFSTPVNSIFAAGVL